jgi:glucose-1-phosphatase
MNGQPAIKAVVFDLGGVLIEICHERAIGLWAAACGASVEDITRLYWTDKLYRRMENGQMSIAEYHRHIVCEIGRPMSLAAFTEGWNSMLGDILPGIEPLLDRLAGKVRLVCLSNTNAPHVAVFKTTLAGLFSRFERVFYSHEMATRKPEPQIYLRVLEHLATPAAQVAFVDDRAENVVGAEAVGMRGVLSTTVDQTIAGLARLGLGA